jgi:ATP-binding cassette subfamily C (CFTR/MRP) protein 1
LLKLHCIQALSLLSRLVTQVALFRLAELASGRILIDGIDIATLGLRKLRQSVAIMPQDAFLFAASIRANLDPTGTLLGTQGDSQLWDVLASVRLDRFVRGLDGGLDARVTEGGDNLSAGQVRSSLWAGAVDRQVAQMRVWAVANRSRAKAGLVPSIK